MKTLNWKSRFAICSVVLLSFAMIATPQAKAVEAICVPWQPSNPSIPHFTYSGAEITLKGIARGGATQYRWDFGDGGSTAWAAISNPYNLGVKHTYSGAVGKLFIATLTVNNGSDTSQDKYLVKIYKSVDLSKPDELDVRINMSIDEGLWYLHTNMIRAAYPAGSPGYGQPYGYWDPSYYPLAAVGTAVDAFQLHGSKANLDYNGDPYVETVQRALNYLLSKTYWFSIGLQPAGNPDKNGNGIGLVANQISSPTDYRQTYIGGICMTALASSGAPNRIAAVGGDNVYGRTYADIVQDMVDFCAWGQVDGGSGRGGWRYYANFSTSDMSTTQWPPLGMLAAEDNMGSTIPDFVRDELVLYLNAQQNMALDNDNGGFKYDYRAWYNITKTAAGIICHEFLRLTPSASQAERDAKEAALLADPKVQSAFGFVYRHWNDSGTSWDRTKLHGNSYGMYGLMKACRIPQPDILEITEYAYSDTPPHQTANTFDWYYTPSGQTQQGLASYCVATQQADGSWDDIVGSNQVRDAMCTGWRILVLLKGVRIIPPEAVICDCDEQEYNFNQDINLDGSCSYHPDITRSIVLYEWDLDNDGDYDDGTGPQVTIPGGFDVEGYYPVALRVTDDNPSGSQTGTYECKVWVHPPPHCPHAFANGPYLGWVNVPVTFDASASWDPDNEIVSYEWDLDGDGEFNDATGINPTHTWDAPYFGVIGLRVTDAEGEFPACSNEDFTTVEIGNHAPVSDPDGPYLVPKNYCIKLDGTGSKDPDPGDTITYAWDLDGDGEFDDSTDPRPKFCVGSEIGKVYGIGLKVTDSFGEYNIAYTTVKIVPYKPVAIDIKPTSCPNPFNVDSRGTLPVAIVGTEDFDVSEVDPASVRLEGVAPLRWSLEDVCTPYLPLLGKEGRLACTEEGPDGYPDLTLKFDHLQIAGALGDVADGDERTLSLKGNLLAEFGGGPILGEDVVVILKKDK